MIGVRGRGPGEFIDISKIFINNKDELFVFDNNQFRLTVYNRNFEFQEHPLTRNYFAHRPVIRSIHQVNDQYVVGIRLNENSSSDIYHHLNLYQMMSNTFDKVTKGLVKKGDLHVEWDGSIPDLVMNGMGVTANSVLNHNYDLIVAPALYTGRLLVYPKNNGYGSHEIIQTSNYPPSYEEYPRHHLQRDPTIMQKEHLNMASSMGTNVVYHHLNRSLGLFRT